MLLSLFGYFYFQSSQTFYRKSASQELASVADLKLNSILIWRNERLEDALSLQKQIHLSEQMMTLLKNPMETRVQNEILESISLLHSVNQYEVFFLDPTGKTLFTFPKNLTPFCENVIQEIPKSIQSKKIFFVDLHKSHIDKKINIGVLIPIFAPNYSQKVIGLIYLRIDPTLYLYPMLQKWPSDSQTAETLLVRREGTDVLFLNELRFKNDSALNFRIPLTSLKTPAVQAALGRIGYFEGLDYRGEPVSSELRPIPNTDWFMVARMDKSEIFASLYSQTRRLVYWLMILSLLFLAFLSGLYKYNKKVFLKEWDEKNNIAQAYEDKVNLANKQANLYLSLIASIIVVIDRGELVSMINEAGCKLLGYSQDEIVGKNWFDTFLDQKEIHMVKDVFSKIISGHFENVEYFENQVLTKDGLKKDIAWHNTILKNPMGEIIGTISSGEDITEKKYNEKELLESEKRFRAIFENSAVGNSLTSPQGKLLKINKALADMLGYTTQEIENLNFADITHPEDIPETKEQIRILLAGEKKIVRFEKRYLHKSNKIVWTEISSTLFHNTIGEPLFLITSIIDITARKRAESALVLLNEELEQKVKARTAELQTSNQELEAFAYSVSHDLRAPLRAIDGFSHMLLDEFGDSLDEEGKRLLGVIRKSTHTMDQLISDLLILSKATRSVIKLEMINMENMVRSIFDEYVSPPEQTKILFITDHLPPGTGDPILIRQVWVNLITNAIKYSSKEENRSIVIKGIAENNFMIYSISDNGIGFNPAYKNKLFLPFHRLVSTTDFEGSGIGLAIVDRIISRHDGKVWAEGEEGQGATFYFSLPKKE